MFSSCRVEKVSKEEKVEKEGCKRGVGSWRKKRGRVLVKGEVKEVKSV